ncbi:UNVERIFIED_CONTAM: hypothetical protein H355_004248, partial [Colinus virginianus]
LPDDNSDDDKELIHIHALISPNSAEDTDLNPPDIGVTNQLSSAAPQTDSECPDSSTFMQEQVSITEEKLNVLKKDLESSSQSQTRGSTMSSEPVSMTRGVPSLLWTSYILWSFNE